MNSDASVVLVAGSLHYDIMVDADHLPRRDETAVGSRWYPKFGGKGGNQAVAARRAGSVARMVGAVGQDDFGRFLLDHLARETVECAHVARLPDVASGMSVAISDRAGDYAATIVSGANLQIDADQFQAPALWQGVRVLVLQNEMPEAVNLAAAQQARARGVTVILNAAPARALPPALRAVIDVLVVNAVEAEMLGTAPVNDLASAAAACHDLAAGFAAVIVTAGSQGLAFGTGGGAVSQLAAEKVKAVSSHGAGDCFTGTLAHALAGGAPLAAACVQASQAAARHVAGGA